MTRKSNLSLFIGMCLLLTASLTQAGGKYKLMYKLNKGEVLKYKSATTMENTQERMGQEIQTNVESENVVKFVCEGKDKDGNLILVYSLESMKSKVKNPMIDTTLVNPKEMLGKRIRYTISPLGKRLKSEKIDTVRMTGLMAQMQGGQQEAARFPRLPEQQVGIGSSWTVSEPDSQMSGPMKMHIKPKMTYTVNAEVDTLGYKCLRIKYVGEVAISGTGEQMGMKIVIDGEGTNNGVLYFAPNEGKLVYMQNDSEFDMNMALTGQMSMTIPSTINTTSRIQLVK